MNRVRRYLFCCHASQAMAPRPQPSLGGNMISKSNFGQALRVIVGCAMMALFIGFATSAVAQEQDTERRFWPPNYRPAAAASPSTPAPSRPAKYKRTSPQLPKEAIPT